MGASRITSDRKPSRHSIIKNKKAASQAVSLVIITAATVVLVLVSGSYALQVLQSQQASSEFDTVQKSILTFDDAVRDIAWDRGGSRSVRFTTNYGNMRLMSSNKSFEINAPGGFQQNFTTAVIKYSMPSSYFTLGNGYSSYVLGNESAVVSSLTDSSCQALVTQEAGFATVALNYRVRVSREGPSTNVGSTSINYVDILLIRLNCTNISIGSGAFDLVAKNTAITTVTSNVCTVGGDDHFRVTSDDGAYDFPLNLSSDSKVVYNVIIADVWVTN
jgi:hypothetical protein